VLVLRQKGAAGDALDLGWNKLRNGAAVQKRRCSIYYGMWHQNGLGPQHDGHRRCIFSPILHVSFVPEFPPVRDCVLLPVLCWQGGGDAKEVSRHY